MVKTTALLLLCLFGTISCFDFGKIVSDVGHVVKSTVTEPQKALVDAGKIAVKAVKANAKEMANQVKHGNPTGIGLKNLKIAAHAGSDVLHSTEKHAGNTLKVVSKTEAFKAGAAAAKHEIRQQATITGKVAGFVVGKVPPLNSLYKKVRGHFGKIDGYKIGYKVGGIVGKEVGSKAAQSAASAATAEASPVVSYVAGKAAGRYGGMAGKYVGERAGGNFLGALQKSFGDARQSAAGEKKKPEVKKKSPRPTPAKKDDKKKPAPKPKKQDNHKPKDNHKPAPKKQDNHKPAPKKHDDHKPAPKKHDDHKPAPKKQDNKPKKDNKPAAKKPDNKPKKDNKPAPKKPDNKPKRLLM